MNKTERALMRIRVHVNLVARLRDKSSDEIKQVIAKRVVSSNADNKFNKKELKIKQIF